MEVLDFGDLFLSLRTPSNLFWLEVGEEAGEEFLDLKEDLECLVVFTIVFVGVVVIVVVVIIVVGLTLVDFVDVLLVVAGCGGFCVVTTVTGEIVDVVAGRVVVKVVLDGVVKLVGRVGEGAVLAAACVKAVAWNVELLAVVGTDVTTTVVIFPSFRGLVVTEVRTGGGDEDETLRGVV